MPLYDIKFFQAIEMVQSIFDYLFEAVVTAAQRLAVNATVVGLNLTRKDDRFRFLALVTRRNAALSFVCVSVITSRKIERYPGIWML